MKVWIVMSYPVDEGHVDKVFISEDNAREYSIRQNAAFAHLFEMEAHDIEDAELDAAPEAQVISSPVGSTSLWIEQTTDDPGVTVEKEVRRLADLQSD